MSTGCGVAVTAGVISCCAHASATAVAAGVGACVAAAVARGPLDGATACATGGPFAVRVVTCGGTTFDVGAAVTRGVGTGVGGGVGGGVCGTACAIVMRRTLTISFCCDG